MAELAVMALTTAGVSAGTAATIGTVMQVGLTAASAFSSIKAGRQEAAGLEIQAKQAGLNARQERLEGKRQALQLQGNLDRDLASQNAMFGARGILQGEGSAAAAEATSRTNATRDIDAARFGADIAALNAEQRASNYRSEAKAAKAKGYMDALGTLGSFAAPSSPKGGVGKVPIPKRKPSLVG